METTEQQPSTGGTPATRRPRGQRVIAVAGAGLIAGLIALGAGNLASAQTDQTPIEPDVVTALQADRDADESGNHDGFENEDEHDSEFPIDLSPDDQAILDRFDTCIDDALSNAGVDRDALDEGGDESSDESLETALDAAFESCDPILDELSEDGHTLLDDSDDDDHDSDFDVDLSPEDEALLGRFDTCLDDAMSTAGLDLESLEEAHENGTIAEADEQAIDQAFDAAFESCDPILDALSAEGQAMLDEWEEACDDDEPGNEHDVEEDTDA